ncbi:persulfide dioxygenase ETHE1, mitochondrial-like [Babylonia areolata]|uniref:persulfide dioxygenase ETHE1, mitochondrial-like n=1 Tax=Babylonia areolata TaxID=304850 RepID=UPI003FD423DF
MSLGNRVFASMLRRSLGLVGGVQSCKVVSIRNTSTVSALGPLNRKMYRQFLDAGSKDGKAGPLGNQSCARMSGTTGNNPEIVFRQLLDYKSYTYTYLLADPKSHEAILIDPVFEMVDRDVALVRELGLDLKFAVNTHVHADHVTGSGEIKKRVAGCRSVIARVSGAKADVLIEEGSSIPFGAFSLECYSTPGHTNGCMTYVLKPQGLVFTGDAVLIRGCGRTDFQQGDAGRLYDSVHTKIFSLPRHYTILPGHDYTGQMSSTVDEELKFNRRLTRTREEFIEIMKQLNLPYPKQIDRALPANMVCGVFDVEPST